MEYLGDWNNSSSLDAVAFPTAKLSRSPFGEVKSGKVFRRVLWILDPGRQLLDEANGGEEPDRAASGKKDEKSKEGGGMLRVLADEDTIILNGQGLNDSIQARFEQITSINADPTTSEFTKTKLGERLAKLSRGVTVIKVGRSSGVEVGHMKDQYDDALNAMRPAVEKGTANLPANADAKTTLTASFDQDLEVSIIRRAPTPAHHAPNEMLLGDPTNCSTTTSTAMALPIKPTPLSSAKRQKTFKLSGTFRAFSPVPQVNRYPQALQVLQFFLSCPKPTLLVVVLLLPRRHHHHHLVITTAIRVTAAIAQRSSLPPSFVAASPRITRHNCS
ncbi:hypothetical protein PILCRDRAFT_14771 [Piloderma croceum F 1598]|uniref:Uncharacterized protein n=1 Tax=Piloderma croceum (strain F 1598) TaxID=765440 RepID=A0A0C3B9P4_PILCF|nr:hypothetical protein PILCRDRAFT_14771 [Piloderma croceum F 1598]